jgi:glyoxylase-like metal-dependent hydrolase (beta-lactamase superfamily II)
MGLFFRFGHGLQGVDILSEIPGVSFQEAWRNRVESVVDPETGLCGYFISADDLLVSRLLRGDHRTSPTPMRFLRQSRHEESETQMTIRVSPASGAPGSLAAFRLSCANGEVSREVMPEVRLSTILLIVVRCLFLFSVLASALQTTAQGVPEWCGKLPRPEFAKLERVAVSDGWFEVYRVAPQTLAIYEPHQSEETIGYLILGRERALLFDTGMGIGDLKLLIAKLTKLPVVVMNSHTHDDHVGNNWQFDTVYGMDTAFTRESAKGSKAAAQAEIATGEICGKLPVGFDRAAYATRPWKIAKWMHDGDRIELGGRTIEILATPGHTPDAICLFDRANGLLFTGDTFYPGTVWIYRPETDLTAYGNSVRRLAASAPEVKLVLGAHNVPVAPPAVLRELANAFEKVQRHEVQGKAAGPGKMIYTVGGISFLMKAPL